MNISAPSVSPEASSKPWDLWSERVGYLCIRHPLTSEPRENLFLCLKRMRYLSKGCAVVVGADRRMEGLLTERAILASVDSDETASRLSVGEVMDEEAPSIQAEAPLSEALRLFVSRQLTYLPVLGDDRAVHGLLSVKSITFFLAEHFPAALMNLPPEKRAVSRRSEGA